MQKFYKEPNKKDFGYEEPAPALGCEGGWMIEGGEEAYNEAVDKYNSPKAGTASGNNKRTVRFKRFIPKQSDGNGGVVPGTGKWEDGYSFTGYFHCWGTDLVEYDTTCASYTVAIVECPDGAVTKVLPENIKFNDQLL